MYKKISNKDLEFSKILNEYLEVLKRKKLITINRTAGLNMVYINKRMNLGEIFEKYFRKE